MSAAAIARKTGRRKKTRRTIHVAVVSYGAGSWGPKIFLAATKAEMLGLLADYATKRWVPYAMGNLPANKQWRIDQYFRMRSNEEALTMEKREVRM